MKKLIFAAVITATLFASCTKNEALPTAAPHEQSLYRVLLIGNGDTTTGTQMFARTETVGIVIAEDSRLKAELINYNGAGVYTVKVTSKVNCDGEIKWGWDGLNISNINPNNNMLPAYGVITYMLTGEHKEGKIKLKLECDCGNSSTLIINITTAILPVKLLENSAHYDEKSGKTDITFTIDDPLLFDWILIQRLNGEKIWIQAMLIASDHMTKRYSIKL